VKQFTEMKKMMKQMGGKGMLGGKRGKGSKSAGVPDDLAAALGSRLGPR
jgi:signal recognition particle GTPase